MDAEVLPVEAHATQGKFFWCADEAANVMPVSLNEAVGFIPWCLARRFATPVARAQRGREYNDVLPSRRVMACSSGMCGSSSRKRQTPLWSRGSGEVRRLSHKNLSAAASGASATHPGKTNSRRSPQSAQRKSWLAESGVAPHEMQRRVAVFFVF